MFLSYTVYDVYMQGLWDANKVFGELYSSFEPRCFLQHGALSGALSGGM